MKGRSSLFFLGLKGWWLFQHVCFQQRCQLFFWYVLLLMVQKSGKLTSCYGKYLHYLPGVLASSHVVAQPYENGFILRFGDFWPEVLSGFFDTPHGGWVPKGLMARGPKAFTKPWSKRDIGRRS